MIMKKDLFMLLALLLPMMAYADAVNIDGIYYIVWLPLAMMLSEIAKSLRRSLFPIA